jgi:succinate-semialdehyde dehydrogenase / glutarate-semialdehyde dehydrogenase
MAGSDTAFRTLNPTTGELVETFPNATGAEIQAALDAATKARAAWRTASFEARAEPLRAAAKLLRERAGEHARTMAIEMGKPLAQGEAEARKCADTCDWFADHARDLLAPSDRPSDAAKSYVRFDPLGTVLAVMPWNFPYWQVIRAAAPALMAGNAVILKHAANVPRCARAIEATFREAGLPAGLFASLFVDHKAAMRLLDDRRVAALTLTGSDRAGRELAERAGRALKKCVLELGGSDPFIVLDDADVERAAKVAADARLLNSGQSCIAAKRFIATAGVHDAFLARFLDELRARKVGDPLVTGTDVGPLARHDLRDALHRQVVASRAAGATVVLGGGVPEGPGAFYPVTVVTGAAPGVAAFDEETFGPVAAVVRAADERQAIELANATRFGLGASLWTRDTARAERIAAEIESGCVFVNGLVKSDPRLPFGGIKDSGFGRELSAEGIHEFVNAKTVWIAR